MGNLADYKRDPIDMLLRLRRDYGDVVRNRLGPFLTYALAHPDHIQYVLQENHRNYIRGRFYDNFKLFFGDGLLTTEGEFWRRHRRIVQPAFHRSRLEETAGAVGTAAMALVERWRGSGGEPVDVVPAMMHLSLAALGLMVFNADISDTAEAVGPAVRFGLEAMMPQGNHNDFIPRWMPTPFNRRVRQARGAIDQVISRVIEEHRDGRCGPSDIISLMLTTPDPDTGQVMTEREVHDEVMTIFLAGHETTGSGLAWALYALAQHPAVLRPLREELLGRLGGRAPGFADLQALPYLEQVVNESLRIYPPIWGYTRDLIEDDEIGGYHIPGGASVFMSPYVTHRHPDFWPNPEAFDPENFGSHAPARHKYAYFPFGGGMRKCIGFQMALLVMRVVIATVVQHLDLAALSGHPIQRGALVALRPMQGIRLVIRPRKGSPATAHPEPVGASEPVSASAAPDQARCPFPVQAGPASSPPDTVSSPQARTPDDPTLGDRVPGGRVPGGRAPGDPTLDDRVLDERDPRREDGDDGDGRNAAGHGTAEPAAGPSAAGKPAGSLDGSPQAEPALRFTWFPVEVPLPPATPEPALAGKRIVIVNGRPSSAERVAQTLARHCAFAHVFAPGPQDDPETAARSLLGQVGAVDGIVDLGLEASFSLAGIAEWEAPMRRTLALMHACYDDWLAEERVSRRFYLAVTWMDGCMGHGATQAGQPAGQPLGGIWAGFAKTLPQELPNCNIRILDLAPDEAGKVGQRVAAELYRWGLFEIGYSGGRRYTLQAQRSDLSPAAPPLGAGDVVLFSGGARGIGLLCARTLAQRLGATVVVTGRDAPAEGTEPWAGTDEAGFRRYVQDQLRAAVPHGSIATVRQEMSRLRRRRELRETLEAIAAAGLPVQYRVCDVTDPVAVQALCAELGPALRVVVHNAGVDRPVRLAGKSAASFIDTVRVKVNGFANLCAAVAGNPNLVRFVNVGSLTGRWGGMTGETDYAAANEALARLGLWAQRHALSCPVKTLVWPTWDGVGMITNLDVTRRYVTTMAIGNGLRHWMAELADSHSGETMFMGSVGTAVTPVQIRGFSPALDLPNIADLVTRHHHAGEPERFRPFARYVTRYRIAGEGAPLLRACRIGGRSVLPAAVLMEHACGAGGWVMPDAHRRMTLTEITDVSIDVDAAAVGGDEAVTLRTEATGTWAGAAWQVAVSCVSLATGRDALRLTLVYREAPETTPAADITAIQAAGSAEARPLPQPCHATWNDHLLRAAEWVEPAGEPVIRIGRAAPVESADLWAMACPPRLALPVNHLENVLRACWATDAACAQARSVTWLIRRIVLSPQAAGPARWVVQRAPDGFAITDAAGRVMLDLQGVSLRSRNDDTAARDPARSPEALVSAA
jgi:cytochrome P450/NAD(P)-dependent dehydrogenase (short-subunit alcohol dehydrogenase family)